MTSTSTAASSSSQKGNAPPSPDSPASPERSDHASAMTAAVLRSLLLGSQSSLAQLFGSMARSEPPSAIPATNELLERDSYTTWDLPDQASIMLALPDEQFKRRKLILRLCQLAVTEGAMTPAFATKLQDTLENQGGFYVLTPLLQRLMSMISQQRVVNKTRAEVERLMTAACSVETAVTEEIKSRSGCGSDNCTQCNQPVELTFHVVPSGGDDGGGDSASRRARRSAANPADSSPSSSSSSADAASEPSTPVPRATMKQPVVGPRDSDSDATDSDTEHITAVD